MASIERDVRAGVLTTREIARRYGCSHTSVMNWKAKYGWHQDLNARVRERADRIVARAALFSPHEGLRNSDDLAMVLANGSMLASVRLEHHKAIAKLRRMAVALMHELDATQEHPEAVAMVYDALSLRDGRTEEALLEAAKLVASIPQRSIVLKTLSETMRNIVGMEREAFGLDTSNGTDGRPTVIIRDFTGRGDPDSPRAREQRTDAPLAPEVKPEPEPTPEPAPETPVDPATPKSSVEP